MCPWLYFHLSSHFQVQSAVGFVSECEGEAFSVRYFSCKHVGGSCKEQPSYTFCEVAALNLYQKICVSVCVCERAPGKNARAYLRTPWSKLMAFRCARQLESNAELSNRICARMYGCTYHELLNDPVELGALVPIAHLLRVLKVGVHVSMVLREDLPLRTTNSNLCCRNKPWVGHSEHTRCENLRTGAANGGSFPLHVEEGVRARLSGLRMPPRARYIIPRGWRA